jgi:hypothetical protein
LTDEKLTSASIDTWCAALAHHVAGALAEAPLPKLTSSNKLFSLLITENLYKDDVLQHITSDQLDFLLRKNVLSVHADETYSLASRYVQTFFKNAKQQQ